MCDWITGSFESEKAHFDTGRRIEVDHHSAITKEYSNRQRVTGSFSAALSFRAPYSHQLEMSGNPVKYMQGHNLFGSDDFENLFFAAGVESINYDSPFPIPPQFFGMMYKDNGEKFPCDVISEVKYTRLDLTRSYRFDSNEEAREWLRWVAATAHSRHRIKNNTMNEGTVYFGQTSKAWAFKIYQKFDEMTSGLKGHGLSTMISLKDQSLLTDWAEGVVRFELTLRSPEIKKLPQGFNSLDVWEEYYGRIQFNDNVRGVEMITSSKLTKNQQFVLFAWSGGMDVRKDYSKNAFYTVRRQILNAVGVDISELPVEKDVTKVMSELKASGWDPEPIKKLVYEPAGAKKAYGL